ncbi:MAG: Na+/H+ antiporter subunit E [Burkholderiaceae bacterium]|jgi:multicomponent Na+:H+ antiporter subunit E|nr:Na+/H+ antiporter subunit E [Burkholderiaceae bacterium]
MIRIGWLRVLLFACLWWVLAEGSTDGWLLGGAAVVAAAWTSLRLWPPAPIPIRLAGLPGFLGFFLWNSLRGGIQVAGMALRGRTALQPALIELPVTLPHDGARVLLINTLSLMPGTVGVDMNDAGVRLHVLDERLPIVAETRALEAVIARLFGILP